VLQAPTQYSRCTSSASPSRPSSSGKMASTMSLRSLFSNPHITSKVSKNGLALLGRPPFLPAAASVMSQHQFQPSAMPIQHTQSRNMAMTKTKRRQREKMLEREKRVAKGLPAKPRPPRYISKNSPVVNAMTRKERDAESRRFDAEAAEEMKVKIATQSEKAENIRFEFDGLFMSDRVRRLFDLKNGSQREVVTSQKRRGMELFQLREGDTGSSAVQVVALTTRIQQLQTHMAKHHKDKSTKRGLDAIYVRRRKLLDYMERKDFEMYRKVVKSLGLVR